ncbi:hypothetical protein QJS10_CPA02g00105 [Acorus calamus]|uniref:BED-type domain-containing protein n=1 Tax=Acorus calamus TaxID=4465 RepID=A0AAV9FF71_ACOCL|nr:hypothetical protein QJS10_CPA02g00105 [Acorus calamus]
MASISNNEPGNIAEMTPVTNKRRRRKSMVWEHFTVETVGSGCTRACCKQCKQTFAYSTGSKLAGTSHLKRHIAMGSCPKIKNQDKKQITSYTPSSSKTCMSGSTSNTPAKRRYRGGYSVLNMLFDQDRSILDLVRMLIIQEYPLHMVEQSAFITFVQNLQPRFRMPTFPEIEMECIAIYEKEKEQLMQLLGALPGRIGLTLSLWTSRQTLGYMCLTGHFIDDDWKVHRRMLNFMNVSSPHTEMALSDAIGACLSDWNMKTRLFTVTIDNSRSSHDLYSANLRDHLSCNSSLMLGGRLFFVRCYAHILSTVAQEALEAIHDVIYNVRESIKYIKSSPSREEKFCEIAEQLQIMNAKTLLSLDVQNHWNTTYLMLVGALELKHAFASLELSEAYYSEAPSMDDWKRVEIVCTHLRHLHDSAKLISSTANPTANIYFHEAWKIHFELSNAAAAEENLAITEAGSTTEVAVMESGFTSEAAAMEAGSSAEIAVTEACVPEEMVVEAVATTEAALAFPKLEPTPHALSTPPPAPPSLQLLTSSDDGMNDLKV